MVRFNSKTAQVSLGFIFLFIIIFAIFFPTYGIILKSFVDGRAPMPRGLEGDLALARVVNKCFVYIDPDTQNSISNLLDENKVTKENLQKCFQYEDGTYQPVKVTISSEKFDPKILSSKLGPMNDQVIDKCLIKLKNTKEVVLCEIKVQV